MSTYTARRALALLPLLLAAATVTFFALELAPGDPAELILGQDATPEGVMQLRRELGLERALHEQYVRYLLGLARGDLGRSFLSRRPVADELARAFPVTLTLAGGATTCATLVGLAIGVLSAKYRGSPVDRGIRVLVLTAVSLPIFWIGLLMIYWFAVRLPLFPTSGWGTARHAFLPILSLSAFSLASITRLTRSAILDALTNDYVRTAHAKGATERRVMIHHVLRNALIPVVTVVGLQFGTLLAGAVVTENVFALPGLGMLLVTAVFSRDYAIIRGAVILVAFSFALINLLVDIAYAILDPRIRYA